MITGKDRMKVRKLSIDVSNVPVGQEFEIHQVNSYWNSNQTEGEQWFGLIGYKQSFAGSLTVLFPAGRPFDAYSLMVCRTIRDTPVPYPGDPIVVTGRQADWIYWEIPNPAVGRLYQLYWRWKH